ncbi:HNH endonuclease [bacterium]|nr:HNH endonuclease [bacterium]
MTETSRRLHQNLVSALDRARRAEQSAVTLFARVWREQRYRDLGHATIELYATVGLGLSAAKTQQFLRLARTLESLPRTRAAVRTGRLSWTKARTVAAVATPRTEARWLQVAADASSRELEAAVRKSRQRYRRERERLHTKRGQGALLLDAPTLLGRPARTPPPEPPHPVEMPVNLGLRLDPVEHARFERLLERLRKQGRRESRAELILAGLAALADGARTRETAAPPCQIVAYKCETCNRTTVRGRPVTPATAAALECDAVRVSPDRRTPNRATIPPAVRRTVLARDGHRCTTPGCGARQFLEVHHVVARRAGGTNEAENLKTLCSACHRFAHEREPERTTRDLRHDRHRQKSG